MNDKTKTTSPPYLTFSAFVCFINKLREVSIPSRIDPSVFGSASGSFSHSTIASLKYLKLINEAGAPTQEFIALVKASDEDRVPLWKKIMERGYPSLFTSDVDLTTITAGQFDEHLRKEFGASGSTVDKMALFFIAGAKMAGITLSPLLRARKPVATSTTVKKSAKQRKRDTGDVIEQDEEEPAPQAKALEYQLIDLMSTSEIDDEVKKSIWSLVQYLMARKAKATRA